MHTINSFELYSLAYLSIYINSNVQDTDWLTDLKLLSSGCKSTVFSINLNIKYLSGIRLNIRLIMYECLAADTIKITKLLNFVNYFNPYISTNVEACAYPICQMSNL